MSASHVRQDFYKILNVNRTATMAEVKVAYRKVAMELHPDRNDGCEQKASQFKEASHAYETLSDHRKRTEYDQQLFGHGNIYSIFRASTMANDKSYSNVKYKVYAPRPPPGFKRYNIKEWNRMHYGDYDFEEALDDASRRQRRIETLQQSTGSRTESNSPLGRHYTAATFRPREERGDHPHRMREKVRDRIEERRRNRPLRKMRAVPDEEDASCSIM